MSRKEIFGTVVSNKMDKTCVVAVANSSPHPKYEKQIVKTKKFKAHDPENKCQIADSVIIQECRPLSKDKYFTVLEITQSADATSSKESK